MHTLIFKEHPIAQMTSPPLPSVHWWSALGSQLVYGESFGQLKSSPTSHLDNSPSFSFGDHQLITDAPQYGTNLGHPQKENLFSTTTSQFTIFSGDVKDSLKLQKAPHFQSALPEIQRQSSRPEYQACFELGLGQPMVHSNYPNINPCYGTVFATYGAQTTGGRIMLPFNVNTEDGPIFVNAKQYRRIIQRRQSRAKAMLENKATRVRKPYLHESRHLHAMRRARGCGGRFLTKNASKGNSGTGTDRAGSTQLSQPSGSLSSEAVHSDSRNANSPKEANGSRSHLSGSEITSIYSKADLYYFQFDHLRPSAFYSRSNMIDSGQVTMPNKWVTTAADSCCDLLKV
ncbi:CCAAT-binding transcription factor [Macleaya cordata]|uniref:Nuclear transcription factor Y subunit n=1 Tax=Macleaya cordata TaxID=56857 RepID=A0A200Q9L9_MACCD|nr:CCAAT-binding transcription factor [Macleaya cordata]